MPGGRRRRRLPMRRGLCKCLRNADSPGLGMSVCSFATCLYVSGLIHPLHEQVYAKSHMNAPLASSATEDTLAYASLASHM